MPSSPEDRKPLKRRNRIPCSALFSKHWTSSSFLATWKRKSLGKAQISLQKAKTNSISEKNLNFPEEEQPLSKQKAHWSWQFRNLTVKDVRLAQGPSYKLALERQLFILLFCKRIFNLNVNHNLTTTNSILCYSLATVNLLKLSLLSITSFSCVYWKGNWCSIYEVANKNKCKLQLMHALSVSSYSPQQRQLLLKQRVLMDLKWNSVASKP